MRFKKTATFLVAVLGLSMNVHSQTTFMTNGLVAYYPFNGNASDVSGNGNNGIRLGTEPATNRFGYANASLHFNGSTDYVEVTNSTSLALGESISASAWICPDVLGTPQGTPGYKGMEIVCKGVDLEGALDWAFGLNGALLRPKLMLGRWTYFDSTSEVQSNVWQHVAFTYDGSIIRTYINGVMTGQQSATGKIRTRSSPMRIGAYSPINGYPVSGSKLYFQGKIDDVRIYSQALSDQEVKELYVFESRSLPYLTIGVKSLLVNMFVEVGTTNQLQSSFDFKTWTSVGGSFVATTNQISEVFDVGTFGQFFRIQQVP